MARRAAWWLVPAFILGAGLCSCDISTGLDNHRPVISSVTVVPATIAQADSTTVMVSATDPDGDDLFYDWTTDKRLRIKGALAGVRTLRGTRTPSMVFYPDSVTPPDTCWVQVVARDIRGLSDSRVDSVIVQP